MNEMNNIPGANESWQQAEQMLDKHFRRRRALVILLAILIPAAVGLTAFFGWNKINNSGQNVASTTVENSNSHNTAVQNNSVQIQRTHSNGTHTLSTSQTQIPSTSQTQFPPNNNIRPSNKKSNTPASGVLASTAAINSRVPVSEQSASPNSFHNYNARPANDHARSEVMAMNRISYIPLGSIDHSTNTPELKSITPRDYFKSGISWMISAYGGPFYVAKSLSTTNDWLSYIDQRKREEENIITPTFGLSVSATMKKLTFSLGAEYATYGEKTNYSPYSLQDSYVENGTWNIFYVAVQQTDTAFVTGNQYFISTTVMRQDSTFNSDIDTVQEKKYDEYIASHNGRTQISYVEVPVMISYNVVSGRVGVGISAGLSPGWLSSTSGYYLSTDSKGLQSLEEIEAFRKFMLNGRVGIDMYYRMTARMCLNVRPQFRTNLNSVFEDSYGVKQKYTSTGILFGVSWLLN